MQDIYNITFSGQDEYELEDEWNLNDRDSMEGSSANSPMEIQSINKNMNDIEVSKKTSRRLRSHLTLNNNEVYSEYFNWIKLSDLKYDKSVIKSASSNISLPRIQLKKEISDLLRAWASVKKNDTNSNFDFQYEWSGYKIKSKSIDNCNMQGSSDILITMNDIPALD